MPSSPILFGSQVNFQKIPLLGVVAENAATGSAPAAPVNGQFWYDTTVNRLYIRENGAWVLASQTGAELTANKNAASGYAGLDGTSKLAIAQVPTGTSGTTVPLGNDARFSDSRAPNGGATGDLTGTYPAPTIAALAVTDAKVATANKDGAAATASMRTLGTGSTQATAGNDGRLSDSRAPNGGATGDLTGTYPAPTIAALAVTDAKVATANKDGAIGTFSMRTLGYTGLSAMPGIARRDQIAAPTADVSNGGFKHTNVATPIAGTDAANKAYVDASSLGLDVKASVRFATTAALTVTYTATAGASARGQLTAMSNAAIDGVTPAANDRVLVKDQATGAQNGIYVITTLGTGANGVWDRASDFDADAEVTPGAFTFIEDGAVNQDSGWVLTTNAPIIIGGASGTSLAFAQFSGAGTIVAGAGMTKTGNTVDVIGTSNRVSVTADQVDISSAYVGQASITTVGTIATGVWAGTDVAVADGGTGAGTAAGARTNLGAGTVNKFAGPTLAALVAGTELTFTHNLNTTEIQAAFRDATTDVPIMLSYKPLSVNTMGITADIAYGSGAVKVVVMG